MTTTKTTTLQERLRNRTGEITDLQDTALMDAAAKRIDGLAYFRRRVIETIATYDAEDIAVATATDDDEIIEHIAMLRNSVESEEGAKQHLERARAALLTDPTTIALHVNASTPDVAAAMMRLRHMAGLDEPRSPSEESDCAGCHAEGPGCDGEPCTDNANCWTCGNNTNSHPFSCALVVNFPDEVAVWCRKNRDFNTGMPAIDAPSCPGWIYRSPADGVSAIKAEAAALGVQVGDEEPDRDKGEGYDVDDQCEECEKWECGAGESLEPHPHQVCKECEHCGECGHDEDCSLARPHTGIEMLTVLRDLDLDEDEPLVNCYQMTQDARDDGSAMEGALWAWRAAGHPMPGATVDEMEVLRLRARITELEIAAESRAEGEACLAQAVCELFETDSHRDAQLALHSLAGMLDRAAWALGVSKWPERPHALATRLITAIKMAHATKTPGGCIDRALHLLQVERGELRPALRAACAEVTVGLDGSRRLLADMRSVERELAALREVSK